jgi:hypothetical protein
MIKHILAIVVWRWSIFSQYAIPTYQKHHLKFKLLQQPMHICPPKYEFCMFGLKKPIPIFSLKCNCCKFAPKILYMFYDPYVGYFNFGHISYSNFFSLLASFQTYYVKLWLLQNQLQIESMQNIVSNKNMIKVHMHVRRNMGQL